MRRVPEVIDVWYDSGAMPYAQYHYPFESPSLMEDGRFPAEYICEAVDQTRGWFYSLHALGVLLTDSPAYRNVICLGHILDEGGLKMSKSRGNIVEPGRSSPTGERTRCAGTSTRRRRRATRVASPRAWWGSPCGGSC